MIVNPSHVEYINMSIKRIAFYICVWFVAFFLVACSAPAKTAAKKDTDTTKSKANIPEPQVGGANEFVKKFDLNKDKRADLWKVYVKIADKRDSTKTVLKLVRQEIDLNGDGKIDIKRFYKDGTKHREIFDLDYDGKFDLEKFYHKGHAYKHAYYLRSKTRPDVFKYFELEGKKRKKKSYLVRKERDTNLDGRIDYWEYWERGNLDRIGRDTDFDGKVDVWEKGSSN